MPNGPPPTTVVPGAGWVDLLSRVIVQVGFPIVVAGVLLWFLLTRFQANMDAITTRMGQNAAAVESFVAELKSQTGELQAQSRFMADQGRLMAEQLAAIKKIEDDAHRLVDIRSEELRQLKERR